MKVAKFFSGIFAALGAAVMALSLGMISLGLNASPRLVEVPQGAVDQSQALADALTAGDFASAGKVLYGQPELRVEVDTQTLAGQKVWQAYLNSLNCELTGACYATDTGIARDATITALDVSGVADDIGVRTHALMTQRVEAAEDMDELYDEAGSFRRDLVEELLLEAVDQALDEGTWITYDVTLTLIQREGQWWVAPDQALLQALSGGVDRR